MKEDNSTKKQFYNFQKFQKALIECSRVNHENFYETIKKINELAVNALGISCSSVWLKNSYTKTFECYDIYSKENDLHTKSSLIIDPKEYPEYITKLIQKRHLTIDKKNLQNTFVLFYEQFMKRWHVCQRYDTAIFYKNELFGILSFETTSHKNFSNSMLHDLSEFLANSIEIALNIKQRKESEEQLNFIANNSFLSIIIYHEYFLYANNTAQKLLGYSLKELQSMHPWDIVVPEMQEQFKETIQRRLQGEKFSASYDDIKIFTKDKKIKTIRLSADTITYHERSSGIAIGIDITDIIHTKQKLQMLAQAIEQMDEYVKITDIDGNILYVNNALIANTGFKEFELLGVNPRIFKSGKHTKAFYKKLWDTILAKKIYRNIIINKKKDGTLFYEDLTISPILNSKGEIEYFVATSKDVSKQIEMEEKLKILATTDALTSIYNRYKMNEEIEQEIKKANRYHKKFALIMFDIDFFKSINDTYGHDVGDHVLEELTTITKKMIRQTDSFGRWGGEEFMILARYIDQEKEAIALAEKIRKKVQNYLFKDGIALTISLGVTIFQLKEPKEKLLKRVDSALYKAKENGRNCTIFF